MRTPLDRLRTWALGVWSTLALVYLFVPIAVIAVFSFNDNKGRFNYTWQGFTLRHWSDPFSVQGLQSALTNSLAIAAIATLLAVILGVGIALAMVRHKVRGAGAVDGLVLLPLATPEVVLGAALLGYFLTLGFARGFVAIVIAHAMFLIGYVVLTVRARLEGLDLHIEEAAMDLGANEWTTLRKVTLPLIAPGVVAAALLSFAISLDEFVITNFTAGQTVTFPLFIYGAARQGVPPEVNAVAIGLLVLVIALLFVNLAVQRRLGSRDAGASLVPGR
jgi:spermidine/putrescine transport system permease protein